MSCLLLKKRERLPSGRIGRSTGICVPSGICKHPINLFNILKDLAVFVCSAGRLLIWYAEPWGLTERPATLPSQSSIEAQKLYNLQIPFASFHIIHHSFAYIVQSIHLLYGSLSTPRFRGEVSINDVSEDITAVPPPSSVRFTLGSQGRPELTKLRTQRWCCDVMWLMIHVIYHHATEIYLDQGDLRDDEVLGFILMWHFYRLWNPESIWILSMPEFRLSPVTYKFEASLCRAHAQPKHLVVFAWKSSKKTRHSERHQVCTLPKDASSWRNVFAWVQSSHLSHLTFLQMLRHEAFKVLLITWKHTTTASV